jgi:hypothetical protein
MRMICEKGVGNVLYFNRPIFVHKLLFNKFFSVSYNPLRFEFIGNGADLAYKDLILSFAHVYSLNQFYILKHQVSFLSKKGKLLVEQGNSNYIAQKDTILDPFEFQIEKLQPASINNDFVQDYKNESVARAISRLHGNEGERFAEELATNYLSTFKDISH